jgi:hypothetical protein
LNTHISKEWGWLLFLDGVYISRTNGLPVRFRWVKAPTSDELTRLTLAIARRMSRMAFSALSFCFFIIVPLQSYDEPNVSLIQTPGFVRLSLTGNSRKY